MDRPPAGHLEAGIQLCERLQDEPALLQPRVRHFEQRLVDRLVSIEQKVEIERAGSLERRGAPVAAEGPFQLEQHPQECPGREVRLELDDPVEEAWLLEISHRLGVPKGRDPANLDPRQAPQAPHRRAQGRLAVAEVRAEGDEGADHLRRLVTAVTLRDLAPRLLIVLAAFLASPSPASADLVQLDPSHVREGARLARSAGGTELARELRIWRVPAYAVADMRRAGVVRLSRPDRMLTTAGQLEAPTDPLVPQQWWRGAIGADRAEAPGPGKPLTVVDSGVDMSHPEFAGRPDTTVLNPQTIREQNEDHGTEVTSVVAAPNNGVGIVGVYPAAVLRIWDASPFGILSESSAIQGIVEAARRGPGVINLSFGGEDDDPLLEEAILFAFRSGSIVVAAAGNDGLEGSPKNYPAAYTHVLTVGATNESGRVAGFSTLSPTIDLAAPGVRIWTAEPVSQDSTGYVLVNGTSFASPLVAGAAAWVWTVRPELDNTQLFELMRRSTTDIADPGFDHASGYGLLNIPKALSFKAPTRDLLEPNEDPAEIEPHGLFTTGTPPLTRPGKTSASISAHVDRSEDPVDLYRVWAPPRQTLRARVTGHATVRLLPRSVLTSKTRPLAVGKRGVAAYRNGSAHGLYVYVELRPAIRFAEYTLRLTAARR